MGPLTSFMIILIAGVVILWLLTLWLDRLEKQEETPLPTDPTPPGTPQAVPKRTVSFDPKKSRKQATPVRKPKQNRREDDTPVIATATWLATDPSPAPHSSPPAPFEGGGGSFGGGGASGGWDSGSDSGGGDGGGGD